MGAIGLFFGGTGTAEITLAAFFVAAIVSILILLYRLIRKKNDEYVAFGPFLVIGAFLVMFLGDGAIIKYFVSFCKWLSLKIIGL